MNDMREEEMEFETFRNACLRLAPTIRHRRVRCTKKMTF